MTRNVSFFRGKAEGRYFKFGKDVKKYDQDVNIIDTIGFCDTTMTPKEVYDAVKDKLQTNLIHVDRVVIVCSGRLENAHKDAIKQFMLWLDYKKHQNNFCFVHSKCDGMEEGQKLRSLSTVCGELGIDTSITNQKIAADTLADSVTLSSTVQMVNTFGFPPKASFEEIHEDLQLLQDCVINCPVYQKDTDQRERIKIKADEGSWCTIL